MSVLPLSSSASVCGGRIGYAAAYDDHLTIKTRAGMFRGKEGGFPVDAVSEQPRVALWFGYVSLSRCVWVID